MSDEYKRLATYKLVSPNAMETVYTAPEDVDSVVISVVKVVNRSASGVTFELVHIPADTGIDDAHFLVYDGEISPRDKYEENSFVMMPGDLLKIYASSNAISVNVYGDEVRPDPITAIYYPVPVDEDRAITVAEGVGGAEFNNKDASADVTLTMPPAVVGRVIRGLVKAAFNLIFNRAGSDNFVMNGVSYTSMQSDELEAYIEFRCAKDGEWNITIKTGSWLGS